jgi:hypothetical protein
VRLVQRSNVRGLVWARSCSPPDRRGSVDRYRDFVETNENREHFAKRAKAIPVHVGGKRIAVEGQDSTIEPSISPSLLTGWR